MREDDDGPLVERARSGDADAFGALVKRHLRAAYAVALAQVGEPSDADDVAQEAFVVALERLDQCRDPSRFSAWLLAIVRTRALNLRRAQRVRRAAPLEAAEAVAAGGSPDRDAERSLLRGRLSEALGGLTPVQREVVLLHDLEGWTHREIARTLDVAEATSRYHLFRGRRALRDLLGPDFSKVT